jgi:hypothetical protein
VRYQLPLPLLDDFALFTKLKTENASKEIVPPGGFILILSDE